MLCAAQRLGTSGVLRRAPGVYRYVIDVDYAGNDCRQDLPGTAGSCRRWATWQPEIVGTIGGDDAILVIVRQEEAAPLDGSVKEVLARLGELRK